MGGSGYRAKTPTTPGGIKRNVGIILKKVLAGPIGPIKVGKKVTFGAATKKGSPFAQPIATAFTGPNVVRSIRNVARPVGPPRIRKPRPTPPVVSKKVIAAKKVG